MINSNMLNLLFVLLGLSLILYVILDVISFLKLRKKILQPLQSIQKRFDKKKKESFEILYFSYRTLSIEEFKKSKLRLKTQELDNPFMQQFIDLLSKLIFSTVIAFAVATNGLSTILFNLSKESPAPDKFSSMFKSSELSSMSLNIVFLIFIFSVWFFLIAASHYKFASIKKSLCNLHLLIIEEIENES